MAKTAILIMMAGTVISGCSGKSSGIPNESLWCYNHEIVVTDDEWLGNREEILKEVKRFVANNSKYEPYKEKGRNSNIYIDINPVSAFNEHQIEIDYYNYKDINKTVRVKHMMQLGVYQTDLHRTFVAKVCPYEIPNELTIISKGEERSVSTSELKKDGNIQEETGQKIFSLNDLMQIDEDIRGLQDFYSSSRTLYR